MDEQTIYAVASGAGRSAIAVVRLSGPRTREVLGRMLGLIPTPRRATYRLLSAGPGGDNLDRCVVLWFPGPASFTGEDCAEFHVHGGRAVIASVLAALGRMKGCRPAFAGEFSRRALLNGKLDLVEVEGLADLINAETEAQRVQALRQLEGELGRLAAGWRHRLIEALAGVEAEIDFSDEGDVDVDVARHARLHATAVASEISAVLDDGQRGERLRDGYTVVIAGPPNSGKSTLLNALARREAAIVSPHEGTTRDLIEVHLDLGGLPVTLVDTAGLREATDPVEVAGIERARARAASADLVLLLRGRGRPAVAATLEAAQLPILTMADLPKGADETESLAVSALTGLGMDELIAEIEQRARRSLGGGEGLITRARHRRALQDALQSLRELNDSLAVELVAENLWRAANALATVTGRIAPDDILDQIFTSFCIGK